MFFVWEFLRFRDAIGRKLIFYDLTHKLTLMRSVSHKCITRIKLINLRLLWMRRRFEFSSRDKLRWFGFFRLILVNVPISMFIQLINEFESKVLRADMRSEEEKYWAFSDFIRHSREGRPPSHTAWVIFDDLRMQRSISRIPNSCIDKSKNGLSITNGLKWIRAPTHLTNSLLLRTCATSSWTRMPRPVERVLKILNVCAISWSISVDWISYRRR